MGDEKSRDEILRLKGNDINEEYANISRFSGMSMSMGLNAREKVTNEISKRLKPDNID